MRTTIRTFANTDSGSTMLGYALVVSLVVLATTLAIGHVGGLFVDTIRSVTPSQEITSPTAPSRDARDP